MSKEIIAEIESLINKLRSEKEQPFAIRLSNEIIVELSPFNYDERVVVEHKTMGSTTVNYTEEGVVVDIYDVDAIDPVQSIAIHRDDLELEDI